MSVKLNLLSKVSFSTTIILLSLIKAFSISNTIHKNKYRTSLVKAVLNKVNLFMEFRKLFRYYNVIKQGGTKLKGDKLGE
jgi:hypothetical protein